ncbi:MAG: hypothetical protein NT007_10075 [Candidatus Kapabacteria bacterium]|nr:hypothetical protein [Candidatus Kapabacteria bacterium]
MRKILLIIGILIGLFAKSSGQWESCNNGISLYQGIGQFVTLKKNIFVGTKRGIYISKNNGNSWNLSTDSVDMMSIGALIVKNNSVLFAPTMFYKNDA